MPPNWYQKPWSRPGQDATQALFSHLPGILQGPALPWPARSTLPQGHWEHSLVELLSPRDPDFQSCLVPLGTALGSLVRRMGIKVRS